MSDRENASDPIEWPGACLCGAVTFRVQLPVTACVHCHCTMCQRSNGAGHVTWIALPARQLRIDRGEDQLVRYASSDHGTRQFCSRCGSALLCQIDERPDEVDIPLANLEPGSGIEPQAHIYVSDRASWTVIDDGLPQLGGKTGLETIET